MKRATSRFTGTVLAGSLLSIISSVALAQDAPPAGKPDMPKAAPDAKAQDATAKTAQDGTQGMVDMVNRIDGTIGLVKPSTGDDAAKDATFEQFKISKGLLDNIHAGDVITYTVADNNGTKTITNVVVPKPIPVDPNE
jgi:hypothetical protein